MDDETLSGAYRHGPRHHGAHVTEDEWTALQLDEATPSDRERLLAHIVACGDCTAIHRSLLTLAAEAPAFDAGVAVHGPASRPTSTWAWTAGLAAAAAIVAAVVVTQPFRTGDDPTRSTAGNTAIGGLTPADGATLTGRRLSWSAAVRADEYEVHVNDTQGGFVWTTRVKVAGAEIPVAVTLPAGRYYWQVIAYREGVNQGTSPITAFRVE